MGARSVGVYFIMNKTLPFNLQKIQGVGDGPLLLITGGVHGDEFEPMAAIRRLAKVVERESLRGTLQLIPVVNEPAFERRNRVAGEAGSYVTGATLVADGEFDKQHFPLSLLRRIDPGLFE